MEGFRRKENCVPVCGASAVLLFFSTRETANTSIGSTAGARCSQNLLYVSRLLRNVVASCLLPLSDFGSYLNVDCSAFNCHFVAQPGRPHRFTLPSPFSASFRFPAVISAILEAPQIINLSTLFFSSLICGVKSPASLVVILAAITALLTPHALPRPAKRI
jgi:hypothetical protein